MILNWQTHFYFFTFLTKKARTVVTVVMLLGLLSQVALAAEGDLVVRFPSVDDVVQREFDNYYLALLTLALQKSQVSYSLTPVSISPISESRSEHNLRNLKYDVHWLHASTQREKQLIPIKVPLFKGLTGWRLLFIAKGDQDRFRQVSGPDQLRRMVAGQGHDWPDTKVLRANYFALETASQWRSLFSMLSAQRFDYYPRSVIEIWREKDTFASLDIEIEQTIVLQYKTAYYFFVSPNNQKLADVLKKGLKLAVEDGSFNVVFQQYLGGMIEKANLPQRKIFHLNNPYFNYPRYHKYWYSVPDKNLDPPK